MNQLSIDFVEETPEMHAIHANPEMFAAEFERWLTDNGHLWKAFVREVDRAAARGFGHYSARTIIEFLRHHTAMAEVKREGWKINNNFVPDMARLYGLLNPERANFFETRVQHDNPRRAA